MGPHQRRSNHHSAPDQYTRKVTDPALAPMRLLVVEDDTLTRTLLVRILKDEGFDVSDFADGRTAIAALDTLDIDFALVDLDLGPGPTGIDVLRVVQRDHPDVGAVILSSFRSTQLVEAGMADLPENIGHLVKSQLDSEDKIIQALLAAAQGAPGNRPLRSSTPITITRSQADLLRLVSQGMSNTAIAEQRQTTVRATEALLLRTYESLGIAQDNSIHSRVQAAIMYQDSEIVLK